MYRRLAGTDVPFMSVPVVSMIKKISISEPEQVMFAFNNMKAIHSCKKEKIQTSKVHFCEKFIVRQMQDRHGTWIWTSQVTGAKRKHIFCIVLNRRISSMQGIFILVINQLDAQNLFYNEFISCLYMFRAPWAHRQEVKIVLYSIWYHQTCRWPSRARDGHLRSVTIPEAV